MCETADPVLALDASAGSAALVYAGPGEGLYMHKKTGDGSWPLKNKVTLTTPGDARL